MNATEARAQAIAWAQRITANPDTIFLDLETTGLGPSAEICDVGIVSISGDVLVDTFVKPERGIPDDAAKVHGVTDAMVADAPSWAEVWTLVSAFFLHKVITIFNASYDTGVIKQCCKSIDVEINPVAECCMLAFADYMGTPGKYPGKFRAHKLDVACQHFGVTPGGHRALADAIACKDVAIAMAGGQYVCWHCGGRLKGEMSICECLRWVHEGKEHPPADHPAWASWASARASPADPIQRPMFDLPDASRFTR